VVRRLFYLPRLFIYHAQSEDAPSHSRFATMERRLFVITTIGATLALAFGAAMLAANPAYIGFNWLRAEARARCGSGRVTTFTAAS
jgi:putative membrane protein